MTFSNFEGGFPVVIHYHTNNDALALMGFIEMFDLVDDYSVLNKEFYFDLLRGSFPWTLEICLTFEALIFLNNHLNLEYEFQTENYYHDPDSTQE